MKRIMIALLGLAPPCALKNFLFRRLGADIGRNVYFGVNLLWKIDGLKLYHNARLRSFNIFRNVGFEIGEGSIFGSFNWVSSASGLKKLSNYSGKLIIGNQCGINSRNYFDCTGGIYFHDFADLAGVRSTFITHQIDVGLSRQTCSPIMIEHHVMVCSNVKVLPGAVIQHSSQVAMGSVVTGKKFPPNSLIAGVPAKYKKNINGKFFLRSKGPVQ